MGKDRPCLILLPLKKGQIIGGTSVLDEAASQPGKGQTLHAAVNGEILIVPIQSDPPGTDQAGLEISLGDKRYIGQSTQAPSYVIVSEVNIDTWPNADMSLIPGRVNTLTYDRPVSGPLLARIMRAFLVVHAAKQVRVLVRRP